MNVAMMDRLRDGAWRLLRPSGVPPRPSWRSLAFDAMVALGLGLLAIQAGGGDNSPVAESVEPGPVVATPPHLPRPGDTPFLEIQGDQASSAVVMLLVVAPLVLRRRYPLAVLWVVMGMATLVTDDHATLRLSFYVCVIASYSAAVYSPHRVPALASLPVAAYLYSRLQSSVPTVPEDSVSFLILIPIAVAADGLRKWKRHADERGARMSALEDEQAEALRRATEHERARIARELHDVVTHNVSVMVIQAGAARKVMDASPEQAREALLAVEAGGRAAMTELRHVMGLLTTDSDGPEPAELTPLPGLDRLEALVTRVRDAGVPIELTIAGQPRPVSPGVELAAYRAVQEALTNTVKHTVGASATVVLEYGADSLRVQITNTGGVSQPSAATGNGRGLMGLRERLAVYGGTLRAGPRLSGGYRVTAQIPLEAS
jgi:signal transduction histidine kinase